jgi:hypothetical protein
MISQGCLEQTSNVSFSSSSGSSDSLPVLNTSRGGAMALSWGVNPGEATAVQVEISTDGVNFAQIQSLAGTATSTTISSLQTGVTYYVRIRSQNAAGESPYSSVVTANIP